MRRPKRPSRSGDQLAIDAGMKWMIDFDEAESAGMALRIPIPAATMAAGLDSLVVFGVVRSLDVADTANQLADLLDAHHYTDGLAFVRPGTPTNNTDDRRAGYSSDDPGHERSFALEVAGTPTLEDNNAPACRHGAWPSVRSDPADVRPRRARPRARRPAHAQHEHRVVAGRLGVLPQQHDRHGSRAHASRISSGRAGISSTTCAASDRCRRCAAARSPMASCR